MNIEGSLNKAQDRGQSESKESLIRESSYAKLKEDFESTRKQLEDNIDKNTELESTIESLNERLEESHNSIEKFKGKVAVQNDMLFWVVKYDGFETHFSWFRNAQRLKSTAQVDDYDLLHIHRLL